MTASARMVADTDAASSTVDRHRRSAAAVLDESSSSLDGLDGDTVERRRAEVGPNELQESGGTSLLALIWGQVSSVMRSRRHIAQFLGEPVEDDLAALDAVQR